MPATVLTTRQQELEVTEFRLTRYELELMDVLWTIGTGTVQDVCDRLDRDLAYTTVMTTLNLLVTKKEVLAREKKGRAFVYRPLVTRDEVSRSILTGLRDVLFGHRLPKLVLSLMEEAEVSPRNSRILREALRKLEEKP
jgi:BlaI family transcriptional regulator, penicillinase repressor